MESSMDMSDTLGLERKAGIKDVYPRVSKNIKQLQGIDYKIQQTDFLDVTNVLGAVSDKTIRFNVTSNQEMLDPRSVNIRLPVVATGGDVTLGPSIKSALKRVRVRLNGRKLHDIDYFNHWTNFHHFHNCIPGLLNESSLESLMEGGPEMLYSSSTVDIDVANENVVIPARIGNPAMGDGSNAGFSANTITIAQDDEEEYVIRLSELGFFQLDTLFPVWKFPLTIELTFGTVPNLQLFAGAELRCDLYKLDNKRFSVLFNEINNGTYMLSCPTVDYTSQTIDANSTAQQNKVITNSATNVKNLYFACVSDPNQFTGLAASYRRAMSLDNDQHFQLTFQGSKYPNSKCSTKQLIAYSLGYANRKFNDKYVRPAYALANPYNMSFKAIENEVGVPGDPAGTDNIYMVNLERAVPHQNNKDSLSGIDTQALTNAFNLSFAWDNTVNGGQNDTQVMCMFERTVTFQSVQGISDIVD